MSFFYGLNFRFFIIVKKNNNCFINSTVLSYFPRDDKSDDVHLFYNENLRDNKLKLALYGINRWGQVRDSSA